MRRLVQHGRGCGLKLPDAPRGSEQPPVPLALDGLGHVVGRSLEGCDRVPLRTGGRGQQPHGRRRSRQQFEGVIWRFRTGGQWREMAQQFGAWSTVHNRFRQWRDAGVFQALLEGLIAAAAQRDMVDLTLVSV